MGNRPNPCFRRVLLVLGLLLVTLLATTYEYIINFTIASGHYTTYVGFDMIAKTREDVPSVRNSMINVTKTGPIEKPRLSQGLGSRGGLLTKKSTMNKLPKRESTHESVKVLRGQMGGDRPVPNKVEEEPTAAADYTDGRDPEEKRRDEQRQERLDRIYELNKRLRQGGNKDRKSHEEAGTSKFSTAFETSSTLRTISTASSTLSSTYSANLPTPKIDKERGNSTLKVQPQQANPEAKDLSGVADQHQDIQLCPEIPPGLQGRLHISTTSIPEFSEIILRNPGLRLGGEYWPTECSPRHQVAIVIPYRRRLPQLAIFLNHLHPILRRQQLHYRIYVVNQADSNLFNRAMLLNVGFEEAMSDRNWTCAIFHDVDLLPEDDRNIYNCPEQPRHMSVAVDKFRYRLPYKMLFGGASAIRSDQFRELNGYSNMFWGWGAEDDDMSKRIRYHKFNITRYKANIARYKMLKHKQERANKLRQNVLRSSHRRYKIDGLNSLSYSVLSRENRPTYTLLSVELHKTKTMRTRDALGRDRAARLG